MWITPYHQDTDFHNPPTFDEKITIFYEQTIGWQLEIAEQVIDNIQNSGYAVLSIIINYFEKISKYKSGFADNRQSKVHFKAGVGMVFPPLKQIPAIAMDSLLDAMYDGVRCGLYHSGQASLKIILNGEIEAPIAYSDTFDKLIISPRRLVTALEMDLEYYVKRLRDTTNTQLRTNFEQRFDYDAFH